jgi:hypothetical protein
VGHPDRRAAPRRHPPRVLTHLGNGGSAAGRCSSQHRPRHVKAPRWHPWPSKELTMTRLEHHQIRRAKQRTS